ESRLLRSIPPPLATEAGVLTVVSRIPVRSLCTAAGATVLAGGILLSRHAIATGAEQLESMRTVPAAGGVCALLASLAASAAAWRAALGPSGATLGLRETWGCYGIGCLANMILPARLGEAVRITAFAARLPSQHRGWASGRACLAVAAARAFVFTGV